MNELERPLIVVIADEKNHRDLQSMFLRIEGYDVATASIADQRDPKIQKLGVDAPLPAEELLKQLHAEGRKPKAVLLFDGSTSPIPESIRTTLHQQATANPREEAGKLVRSMGISVEGGDPVEGSNRLHDVTTGIETQLAERIGAQRELSERTLMASSPSEKSVALIKALRKSSEFGGTYVETPIIVHGVFGGMAPIGWESKAPAFKKAGATQVLTSADNYNLVEIVQSIAPPRSDLPESKTKPKGPIIIP